MNAFQTSIKNLVENHKITSIHAGCYVCNYEDDFICHRYNNGCKNVDKCKSIYEKEKVNNARRYRSMD